MQVFLRDFFTHFGATVLDEGPILDVALPTGETAPKDALELARRFGRDHLKLAFDLHEVKPGIDLVAAGGHILRTIEEFLEKRGRRGYVVAPATMKVEKAKVLAALSPVKRVSLVLEERTDDPAWDVHFLFRMRYRGRERKDSLVPVLVPVKETGLGTARRAPFPEGAFALESRPRKHLELVRMREAFASALEVVDEVAWQEALDLEAHARARLERDASRLEIFYDTAVVEQQTNRAQTEVSRRKIEDLEEERDLKRRELAEGARVEAEAEPLQALVIERPHRKVGVRVTRAGTKGAEPVTGQIELAFDLSHGAVFAPHCPSCKKPLASVTVCDGGHVIHEGCATACTQCRRLVCGTCGAVTCAQGGEFIGPECACLCERCQTRVCTDHMGTCSVCKTAACTACLHACAHCGEKVCADDRLSVGADTSAFLCKRCGVACAGCGRAEPASHLGRCGTCGRRLCSSCLEPGAAECSACRDGKGA